eukprot:8766334-Pyramimonas_sp.AAC.1
MPSARLILRGGHQALGCLPRGQPHRAQRAPQGLATVSTQALGYRASAGCVRARACRQACACSA